MRGFWKIGVVVWALVIGIAAAAEEPACGAAADAMSIAASIRHLRRTRSVPCVMHNKEQIKEHLLATVQTELPPQKLEYEGLVYRAVGMVPDDFDYKNRVVDIYISQIGGYYDPKKKRFVMADWSPGMMQTTLAVHELTHALQDQHFDLNGVLDMKRLNGDELLARSAVIEGDATAVMLDYNLTVLGQPAIAERDNVESLMLQNVIGAALTSSLQSSPRSLVAMMIFPYTSGLRFVHYVLRRGGYAAVDKLYARPPRSSEEILHPEKYFSEKPDFVTFNDDDVRGGIKEGAGTVLYADVLGEFSISALLYFQEVMNSGNAAAGWGGDRIVVFAHPQESGRVLVAWRSHWDTPEDAEEFVEAYEKGLRKRYGKAVDRATWNSLGPSKKLKIERTEREVSILIEVPAREPREAPAQTPANKQQ